jgi:hypothetical protein
MRIAEGNHIDQSHSLRIKVEGLSLWRFGVGSRCYQTQFDAEHLQQLEATRAEARVPVGIIDDRGRDVAAVFTHVEH